MIEKTAIITKIIKLKLPIYLLVILIVSFFMQVIRRPDALINPQFYADDGYIFFKDAFYKGAESLLMPHAGYWNLLPRLIAYVAIKTTDILYQPLFYSIVSMTLLVFTALIIFCRTHENKFIAFLLAISITCLPTMSEVYLSICAIQFYAGILLLFPFIYPGKKKNSFYGDILILVLVGLSGPFVMAFAPFIMIHQWYNRKVLNFQGRILTGIYVIIFVIQIGAYLTSNFNRVDKALDPFNFFEVVINLFYLTGVYPMHIDKITHSGIWWIKYPVLLLISSVFISLFILAFKRYKMKKPAAFGFLMGAICVFSVVILSFISNLPILHPYFGGQRYFFIPTVLTAWAIILILPRKILIPSVTAWIIITLVRFEKMIPVRIFENKNWPVYAQKIKDGERPLSIPIPEKSFLVLER